MSTLLDESAIGLAGKETAIGDSIGLAIRTLEDAGVEQGRRVLLLLTDGANTAGAVEPLKAAELAAQRKHGHLHDRHRRRCADGALAVRLARRSIRRPISTRRR